MEQPTVETKIIRLWNLREEFRSVVNSKIQSKLEPAEITVKYYGECGGWKVVVYPSLLVVAQGTAFTFSRNVVNKSLDAAIEEAIKESEKELKMAKEGKVKSI